MIKEEKQKKKRMKEVRLNKRRTENKCFEANEDRKKMIIHKKTNEE